MTEYWGAQASWPSAGPYGQLGYGGIQKGYDIQFTPAFNKDNPNHNVSIEQIKQQIEGQHPEDISLLADQWQNAYNLLSSIRTQLLDQANALANEHWTSPEAKERFLMLGPGQTLAYLDEWMTACSNNVTALRALVGVAKDSRDEMTQLWGRYEDAIRGAETIDFGERANAAWKLLYSMEDLLREEIQNDLEAVRKEYSEHAQNLAYKYANQYFETMGKVSGGAGPPFLPMDAVLNKVGHEPWPNLPGGGNLPGGVPPQLGLSLQLTNPVDAGDLPQPNLDELGGPPDIAPPDLVDGTVEGLPSTIGGLPPVLTPPALNLQTGNAKALGHPPALTTPNNLNLPTVAKNPSILQGGLPHAPGTGSLDGQSTLRNPNLPPAVPPGGRGLKNPRNPAAAGPGQDRPGTPGRPGIETEDAFSRPPSPTAPPVLNNRPPARQRPGQDQPHLTRFGGGGDPGTPGSMPPGAVPPVLKSPAQTPSAPPPGTPGRTKSDQDRTRQGPPRQLTPGSDWMGLERIRSEASSPILDTPMTAGGPSVSKLEEVPKSLRNPHSAGTARPGARPGSVAPDVVARHTRAEEVPTVSPEEQLDEGRRVSDEDAFVVETPGGGVLVKDAEKRSHRTEPPTALGGR